LLRTWDFKGPRPDLDGRRAEGIIGTWSPSRHDDRPAACAIVTERALRGGAVVFLTGLSGSGKSTIADALAADLRAAGRAVKIIDGDVLREQVSADLGFDAASREANVRRAAELAARFAADGQVVISALISPFERSRHEAREIVEQTAPFLLVYVSTPIEVAEARDPKGLYRRARVGEIPDFTGIDSPYEAPIAPDLDIDTTRTPVAEAVATIRVALDRALEAASQARDEA
jgi:adenylyl-sulfate kinase